MYQRIASMNVENAAVRPYNLAVGERIECAHYVGSWENGIEI